MIFIDKLFPFRVKDKMASLITKKAILFDFLFPMYEPICTIFTKRSYSQYLSHSVQYLHFHKNIFTKTYLQKHSLPTSFLQKHFYLQVCFQKICLLQNMFFKKSKFTKQIHKYHYFPVTLGLFSQAFIAIRYSVSFIDYDSFAIYRTKRFRLRFTGDRSIFVSFDSTIISNLNF